MKLAQTKLKNGITLITVQAPNTNLVSSNVMIKAGSRYETKELYGLSHFLEHMVFKGTKDFPTSAKMSEAIEDLGGIVNAWTSEEATCYWNILPEEHFDTALHVLSDQISKPLLREADIDMERGPVLEEIKRNHDDPYAYSFTKIIEVMWPNQPISNGILGQAKSVENIKKGDFQKYLKDRYIGSNICVCIVSALDDKKILKAVEKYFKDIPSGTETEPEPITHSQKEPNVALVHRDIKQAHTVFGYKTFGIKDKRVPALKVLMNILATGMGSLLFKEIREKHGAAYAVEGASDYFSDAGAIYLYAGLDTKKVEEVIRSVKKILKGLRDRPLSENRIEKAKEFIKGITLFQLDGVERAAKWYTSKGLLDPDNLDPKKFLNEINGVTAADVQAVAQDVLRPENESLVILGPFKDTKKFAKILAE